MPRLTKRFVDSLQPEAAERCVWDEELPGFGLRIWPSGRRVFIIQYRNVQGRSRRVTLGRYGLLTAEQARAMAQRLLSEARQGGDPAGVRDGAREAPTVAQVAARYLEQHARVKKKPKSFGSDEQLLRRIILPALGARRIGDVQRPDLLRLQHEWRSTPIQANRAMALLSKMFNLAESWGLRPDGSNPCRHVERYRETRRERYLSAAELARLGEILSQAERNRTVPASAILAVRLLILTGARLGEIMDLRWEHVDLEGGALRLPDSKTGAKLIPLGRPAIALLGRAPRLEGNPYVCPGRVPGARLVGLQHVWERLRARAGLPDVRLHDLRHSFASVGAGAGLGLPILGKLLGHARASTTERYAHVDADPLRMAADLISQKINKAMKQPVKPKVFSFSPDQARSDKKGA